MEAVEIVVYIFVAVLLGGLVLFVTMELASPQVYENIKGIFVSDSKVGFSVVNNETVAHYLFSFWDACNYGATPANLTFQYVGDNLTKEELFSDVIRLRLCNTLSSAQNNCGSREDVTIVDSEIVAGVRLASCYREDGVGYLLIE